MFFDSNCAAGKIFGIPLRGTHSHAFVSSFMVGIKDNLFVRFSGCYFDSLISHLFEGLNVVLFIS